VTWVVINASYSNDVPQTIFQGGNGLMGPSRGLSTIFTNMVHRLILFSSKYVSHYLLCLYV
jgi:hypothetical protein